MHQLGQTTITLPAGALQPFESFILVPRYAYTCGDLKRRRFGLPSDQLGQRGIGFRHFAFPPSGRKPRSEAAPTRRRQPRRGRRLFEFALPADR